MKTFKSHPFNFDVLLMNFRPVKMHPSDIQKCSETNWSTSPAESESEPDASQDRVRAQLVRLVHKANWHSREQE